MADKRQIRVTLIGDHEQLSRVLKSSEGELERWGTKTQQLGRKVSSAGDKLSIGLTLPLILAGKASIDTASDFEQSVGAIESVFGPASRKLKDFGDTAADAFGLSRREVNETGAVLGAQLQSMGRSSSEAADEVIILQQRAADMAATFGGTTREALEAISALLRGERDPIEKYGVAIKAVDVNARIAALGLDTSTVAAAKHAEATAALSLLLEQTAAAEGQFGREAETAAGQQARATAEFENARAEFGKNLLPLYVEGVGVLRDLTGWFANLSPEVQQTAIKIGLVAAATGPLLSGFGRLVTVGGKVAGGVQKVVGAVQNLQLQMALGRTQGLSYRSMLLQSLNPALVGVTAALAVGAGALLLWKQRKDAAREATDDYVRALEADSGALAENTRSAAFNRLAKEGIVDAAAEAGVNLRDLADAALGEADAFERVREQLDRHRDELGRTSSAGIRFDGVAGKIVTALKREQDAVARATEFMGYQEEALSDASEAHDSWTRRITENETALEKDNVVIRRVSDSLADQKSKADLLEAAFRRLTGTVVGQERASINYHDRLRALTDSLKENGSSLDVTTEKGRANRGAVLDLVDAIQDHVKALEDDGATMEELEAAFDSHVEDFRRTMRAAGLTEDQVNELIDRYKLVPDRVFTGIEMRGFTLANQTVDDYIRRLGKIGDTVASIAGRANVAVAGSVANNFRLGFGGPEMVAKAGHGGHEHSGDLAGAWGGPVVGNRLVNTASFTIDKVVELALGNLRVPGSGATISRLINVLRGRVPHVVTDTLRPGSRGYHGLGRAVDFSIAGHGNRGYRHPGLRRIFEAFLPYAAHMKELILAGAPFNIKNGRKVPGYAWGRPGQPGNHWNHVHAALERGGRVRLPGRFLVGEGGRPEIVNLNRGDMVEPLDRFNARSGREHAELVQLQRAILAELRAMRQALERGHTHPISIDDVGAAVIDRVRRRTLAPVGPI